MVEFPTQAKTGLAWATCRVWENGVAASEEVKADIGKIGINKRARESGF